MARNTPSGRYPAYARALEAEFRDDVLRTLGLFGYLRTAIRRSDGVTMGDSGLPDVIAVHPRTGAFLPIELKVGDRVATAQQDAWLRAFSHSRESMPDRYAPAADLAMVVRPGDSWRDFAVLAAELAGRDVSGRR